MTDSTTGDLEQRVSAAIEQAQDLSDPFAKARAVLKAHAEWLEEQGLVVVPKDDRTTAEVWSELPRAIAQQEDQHND